QTEGRQAIAIQTRGEAREVARVTGNFARIGQGRKADADRAAAELDQRNADVLQAEAAVLAASARLCELLDLDPSVRLHAVDGWVVPAPLVPEPIPLAELIAIGLTQRPELAAGQVEIRAALLRLREAKLLPFSPNLVVGFSAGAFGGGSNLVAQGIPQPDGTVLRQPRFDSFDARTDFDAVVYWSLRNLGLGNVARVRLARSNLRSSNLEQLETLNRVRAEVAAAHARVHARFAQIETGERAVRSSQEGFREDLERTRGGEGLPIEVLDSLRLLGRSRYAYLDAILEYNRAQFELYVALGQPPAKFLARPIPASLVPPSPPPDPALICPPAGPR
ncbi:MAG: TolC family protein, partial [Planctomycetes bacterium]|nr:TolC family protein [Planctomycetota bacterium]